MVKKLRRHVVAQGIPDSDLPGHILVPVRRAPSSFPKVNYSVPDTSYFRVDERKQTITAVVTVTPDNVPLGWDSCGTCALTINKCQCASGISLPNAIGYIFVSRGGTKPLPVPRAELAPVFRPPMPRTNHTSAPTPRKTLKRPVPEPPPRKKLKR